MSCICETICKTPLCDRSAVIIGTTEAEEFTVVITDNVQNKVYTVDHTLTDGVVSVDLSLLPVAENRTYVVRLVHECEHLTFDNQGERTCIGLEFENQTDISNA